MKNILVQNFGALNGLFVYIWEHGGRHTNLYSGLTSGSALRGHSWWCSGYKMMLQGLNQDLSVYLLQYHFGPGWLLIFSLVTLPPNELTSDVQFFYLREMIKQLCQHLFQLVGLQFDTSLRDYMHKIIVNYQKLYGIFDSLFVFREQFRRPEA